VEAFLYDDFSPADTRVVSLGTGSNPAGKDVPTGLLGWLHWTVATLLDAPEDQQPEIVNLKWPGILKRKDWPLPEAIDVADTSKIDFLVEFGKKAAAGLNWGELLAI
jgi:hypothetical protein